MIKAVDNQENKRWIGNTAGLLKLRSQGLELRYGISTGVPEYAVRYAPRSKYDPMPWVQAGGLESRLRSTEIVAIDADVFAAWEAEQDAKTDEWISSIDRSLNATGRELDRIADGVAAVDAVFDELEAGMTRITKAVQGLKAERGASPRYATHSFLSGTSMRFAVKDTETGIDVDTFSSRYAARDKADRMNTETGNVIDRVDAAVRESAGVSGPGNEPLPKRWPNTLAKCAHGFSLKPGVTSTVPCGSALDYGVFGDEGPVEVYGCAVQAANDAAFYTKEDDSEYVVRVVCPDHEDRARDHCEECNS